MTIALRGVGAVATGSTSVDVYAPVSPNAPVANDVLVAFICDHSTTNAQSAAPTGWQARGYAYSSGYRFQVFSGVFGKNSLSGTHWVFGTTLTTRSVGMCIAYSGADTTGYGGLDCSVSVRHNASGTYGTLQITTATNNAMVIAAFCSYVAASTYNWTAEKCGSTNLNEQFDNKNSTYCSIAVADLLWATAGATGASTATPTTGQINAGILLALKPLVIVEGTASGSGGNGLTGATSLDIAIGTVTPSSSGLASSLALLYALGLATASGAGVASSLALLYILALSQGSSEGVGVATGEAIAGYATIEGIVTGSGEGVSSSLGILDILAQVAGSGAGLATGTAYLVIPTSVLGSGEGQSSAGSYLLIPAIVSGSGEGQTQAISELTVLAQVLGSGASEGSSQPYLIILPITSGSGLGTSNLESLFEILGDILASGESLASAIGGVVVVEIIEGQAEGSGIGEEITDVWLIIPNQAEGSGIGSIGYDPYVIIESDGSGAGIGVGQSDSLVGAQELYDLFAAYEEEYMLGLEILQALQPKIDDLLDRIGIPISTVSGDLDVIEAKTSKIPDDPTSKSDLELVHGAGSWEKSVIFKEE